MAERIPERSNFPNLNPGISCVIDGEERIAKFHRGCDKCPNTGKDDFFFEVSMKNKKKSPLSSHILQSRSSRKHHSSPENAESFTDHVVNLKHKFQAIKIDQRQTQNPDDGSNNKSDIIKLEKLIAELDIYSSSLKAKLKPLREKEADTCNAEAVSDVSSPSVSCSSIHSATEHETSDDEIGEMIQKNKGMAAEVNDRLNISVEQIWEGKSNVKTPIPSIIISDSSDDDDITDISKANEDVLQETP